MVYRYTGTPARVHRHADTGTPAHRQWHTGAQVYWHAGTGTLAYRPRWHTQSLVHRRPLHTGTLVHRHTGTGTPARCYIGTPACWNTGAGTPALTHWHWHHCTGAPSVLLYQRTSVPVPECYLPACRCASVPVYQRQRTSVICRSNSVPAYRSSSVPVCQCRSRCASEPEY